MEDSRQEISEGISGRKIHMVGIGGIGMSGLAFVLAGMGSSVSGSDAEENDITKRLRKKGISVRIGHDASWIKDRDLVVFSSSIRPDNPELLEARKKKISVIPRMELLRQIMDGHKRIIGITGTHGKTTITAMVSLVAEEAGLDPTVLIGGESPHFGGNAKLGKGGTLVAEVDESDGRLVILNNLTHVIVPNLEKEHVEHYRDEAHLLDVFGRFLGAQSRRCVFFYRIEDANLRKLAARYGGRVFSFGFADGADLCAKHVKIGKFKIDFECFRGKKSLGHFTINIPGIHNILNALAAVSLGTELGVGTGVMKRALSAYRGVKRRFEVIGDASGAKIVEDYAHHPTEIKATISAACSLKPKKIITVFQPHRYTRTKSFYKEFSASFAGSDEVILTEVYPASEDRIDGAGAKSIYDVMSAEGSVPVRLLQKEEIPRYLKTRAKKGDIILILGAGDIGKTSRRVLAELKNEKKKKK